jgi:hypothetical protein
MRSIRGHRRVVGDCSPVHLGARILNGPHARESGDDGQDSHNNANRAENPECPRTTS